MRAFCRRCGKEVFPSDFRTDDSLRQFMMWELCQDCQDEEELKRWTKSQGLR